MYVPKLGLYSSMGLRIAAELAKFYDSANSVVRTDQLDFIVKPFASDNSVIHYATQTEP